MPKKPDCTVPVQRAYRNMAIPLVILVLLIPTLLFFVPGLTSLSLFGIEREKACDTGINLSVNSSFYVTVYNSTATYENQNESYYLGGIELMLITLDPVLAKFINDNPTNWSNIIDATNFTSYIEMNIIFPFKSKNFNISALSFLYDVDNYDGYSVSIKQAPSFIIAGMGGIIMRDDGEDFEEFSIGFINESIASQNQEFVDYMASHEFTIFDCADGYLDIDLEGMWFNTTSTEFDKIDMTVEGSSMTYDNIEGSFFLP